LYRIIEKVWEFDYGKDLDKRLEDLNKRMLYLTGKI